MQRSHSRHTLPADKPISVEIFCNWHSDRPGYKPTQTQRKFVKRFHTRKSRSYLKQQTQYGLGNDD